MLGIRLVTPKMNTMHYYYAHSKAHVCDGQVTLQLSQGVFLLYNRSSGGTQSKLSPPEAVNNHPHKLLIQSTSATLPRLDC